MTMQWIRPGRAAATWLLTLVLSQAAPALAAEPSPPANGVRARSTAALAAPAAESQTDRLIVKYKDSSPERGASGASQADRLSKRAGLALRHHHAMSGNAQVFSLPKRMARQDAEAVARRLAGDPAVEYAEPDLILTTLLVPNDTSYASQWHYQSPDTDHEVAGINLPPAWEMTTGSSSVVVAVLDTGIVNHADLQGRILPGYNFISNAAMAGNNIGRTADASDLGDYTVNSDGSINKSSWHGTHVTGTIAATTNNGAGVAGINWNSKILPVRVLGRGGGYNSDIIDGMRWAAGLSVPGAPMNPNPARILSMSLGGQGACSSAMQSAVTEINSAGAMIVVAAGNSTMDASYFTPANCNGVVAVASVGRSGGSAYYTDYGSTVKIAAPGGDTTYGAANGVLSTLNTGTTNPVASPAGDTYAYYQGTSMATPHVAGVASLLLSANPALTPDQLLGILQASARPFPSNTGATWGDCFNTLCGSGILDAYQAVRAVSLKAPLLNATPLGLTFAVPSDGSSPAAQTIKLSAPNGSLSWNVTSSAPWLQVTPASGQDAATLTVTIDPSALTAGTERPSGSLTISADGAANSPVTIPVGVGFLARQLAPMPSGQEAMTLSAVNGKLYAIGGWPTFNLNQIYDPATNTWSNGKLKPTGVSDTDAVVINGKIYIPGGRDQNGAVTSKLEIYDPATDQWTTGASLPAPRMAGVVQTVNGKLYLFSGMNGSTFYNTIYSYDPVQNSWSTVPNSAPYIWDSAASSVLDGKVYLYGGYYTNGKPAVFDPATNSYLQLPRLNLDRTQLAGSAAGDRAYGIGGYGLSLWQDSEYFEPTENRWKFSPLYLSSLRWGHKAAAIGNSIYVMGGMTEVNGGSVLTSANESFTVQSGVAQPVNGICGSASTAPLSSAPTSGLCASGLSSAVSGTGPWTWSCGGLDGGTSVNCSTYTPLSINVSLPYGIVGNGYGATLTVAGGTPPYTWSLINGSTLPAGLSFDTTSTVISGTPLSPGTFFFWLRVVDSLGYGTTKQLSLWVRVMPAMIGRTPAVYYNTLQNAISDCANGENILLAGSTQINETVSFNRAITATLTGGYSDDYKAAVSATVINGKLSVTNGKLKVNSIRLR
ncbi:MAG TPA: S8 family serine peptidase [Geomonas sp.]|nr:S8 family serine peptidase [Geomonas sp.]